MKYILKGKWLKHQSPEQQAKTLEERRIAKRARNRRANRIYAERHPDRVTKRRKAWEAKNSEYRLLYNRKWRAEHPGRHQSYMKAWRLIPKNRMRSIVKSRIADAKRRGIPVDKDALLEFIENPPTHCAITGIALDYSTIHGRTVGNSPSIDRIDPDVGYVRGNIAILSHRINTIKSFGTASEHRLIAEFLERHGNDR